MTGKAYKYVFGPVASRRLGRSLGVDLVPLKVCPLDCIYCQLGPTTVHTARRDAYVPTEEVLAEVAARLEEGPAPDYVTLAGSGEPTLHRDLGRIILAIKAMTDVPLAVLTNGVLLEDPDVRAALLPADVVIPDLDAGDEETFRRINRPCRGITLSSLVAGLTAFRREYAGRLVLEVFLVAGVNDSDEQVRRIAALAEPIGPDAIEVNTVYRPPGQPGAKPVDPRRLDHLCRLLGPKARVIGSHPAGAPAGRLTREDLLAAVRRHPSTVEDLAATIGCGRRQAADLLEGLLREGTIVAREHDGKAYYQAAPPRE